MMGWEVRRDILRELDQVQKGRPILRRLDPRERWLRSGIGSDHLAAHWALKGTSSRSILYKLRSSIRPTTKRPILLPRRFCTRW
jgi:hypothetical protein